MQRSPHQGYAAIYYVPLAGFTPKAGVGKGVCGVTPLGLAASQGCAWRLRQRPCHPEWRTGSLTQQTKQPAQARTLCVSSSRFENGRLRSMRRHLRCSQVCGPSRGHCSIKEPSSARDTRM
jgi:hypothetical protein